MPRSSARKKLLGRLRREVEKRRRAANARFLLGENDAFEEDFDDLVEDQLLAITNQRYVARQTTYRSRQPKWWRMLNEEEGDEHLNDEEFLGHFRVTRELFHRFLALIENHEVFQSDPQHQHRGNADLHLMILLKYLGSFGNSNSASSLALFFGLGKGSIANYLERATTAILSLQDRAVTWPNAEERRDIGRRIQAKHGFPNCVGLIDGTLLPLAFEPTANGEEYYTRKGNYAVNALITCDDVGRVRDVVVGWPGSVHDNRVWTNGRLCQDPYQFFSRGEYLLGDSAFKPSEFMIPAFKNPPKAAMNANQAYFNRQLAGIRIKAEHCIGLLKARFQFFKGVRIVIDGKPSMQRLIRLFMCACVFHNMLIAEPVPAAWQAEIQSVQLW